MKIDASLLARVVEHAQRDAPTECCGVLAVRAGVVQDVVPLPNAKPTPFSFEIEPAVLLRAYTAIQDTGAELGVIYHSHTRSAPVPSQTDINFAVLWPGVEWLIVGTSGTEPEVRSYLVTAQGEVTEVPVQSTGGT